MRLSADMKTGIFSDAELLEKMTESNGDAFKEIYHRYWKQLYFQALKKIRIRQVAEDLVQNVFVSLWNRRHENNIRCLNLYLQQAIRFQVINYLDSKFFQNKNITAAFPQEPEEGEGSDSTILHHELSIAISKAIQKLPGKSREVIQFRKIDNYSVRQISERMHISEKTVEYHITRSIKLMRYYLKDFFLLLFLFKIF